jgi:SAM-dependent methyltransferase
VENFKLNVGCGTAKSDADVNCDLYIHDVGHRGGDTINLKATPNFVYCDAQHLPFQNKTFSKVYCFHVIEHVPNPSLLFSELIRVCSSQVVLRCPHKDGSGAKLPSHIHFFGFEWFINEAKKLDVYCSVKVRSFDSVLPKRSRKYIPLPLKRNLLLCRYLAFFRHYFNPNHVVPDSKRPPFEIEACINVRC